MSTCYILVGIPGSGKTYIGKQRALATGAVILSSDEYRLKLFGDENDQAHNQEVFTALYKDARKYLAEGKDIIFDATNTTLKARHTIFDQLKGLSGIRYVAIVLPTPYEKCVEQDAFRTRTVGRKVVYKFYSSFQFPQKFEGFDEIEIYGYTDKPKFNGERGLELFDYMCNIDQQNPHHLWSLGNHCGNVAYPYSTDNPEFTAGFFHDVGKLFTKTVDEQNIAHYYSHDSIGTYFLLTNLELISRTEYTWDDIYEVLFFVNYHMKAHKDFRTAKAEKKYRTLFGDDLYDRLILFADRDVEASGTESFHEELTKLIKEDKLTLQEFRQTELYKKAVKKVK